MTMVLMKRHLLAGLLFVVLGASVALMSLNYSMGSLRNMGPGFLPFWLGILLVGLGSVAIIQGALAETDDTRLSIEPRQLFFVLAAIVSFGLLMTTLGTFLSVIAMTLISSFALKGFGTRDRLLAALVLSVLAWLTFHYVLGLPLPLWPQAMK